MFDNHMVFSIVKKNFIAKLFYLFTKFFLSKIISNVAFKVIGVTDETCKYLVKLEGYNKKKIFHLPLGIDNKIFFPKNLKKKKTFKIIQTGKLNNDKKPQWTAEAVLHLLKMGENISLEFIGKGSQKIRKEIKTKFKENNFSKKIKFTNFLSQKSLCRAYNQSNLCIFPEGTSLSALEIAACKKPVIMANHLASKNRAKLGIGLTYERGNITDLKKKIFKLLKDKNFYNKVCNNSYKTVKYNFTYDHISKTFLNLCEKAVLKKNEKI